MKKIMNGTSISILVLALVFVFQLFYMYNNTNAKTILNINAKTFNEEPIYHILDYATDLLLDEIDEKENKTITMIFDDDTSPYKEFGVGYLYIRNKVFPMIMRDSDGIFHKTLKDKIDFTNEQLYTEQIDYLLLLGKGMEIFDVVTENDFTLYKVIDKKNNIIEKIKGYDLSLYMLYDHFGKNSKEFIDMVNMVENSIEEHWNFTSIDLMYGLFADLYNNNEYEDAIKYGNYYLNKVDYINDSVNIKLGEIYTKLEKYEDAIHHYNICKNNSACDAEEMDRRINNLKEVME